MALKCMFDTVVFNRIRDGKLILSSLNANIEVYATHIQRDELNNTPDPIRREALLQTFREAISPTGVVPTSSAVFDVSRYDECRYSGPESLYSALRAELDVLNRKKANNVQDALIADTAISEGYVLVTEDGDLAKVTRNHGGDCLSVSDLLRLEQKLPM